MPTQAVTEKEWDACERLMDAIEREQDARPDVVGDALLAARTVHEPRVRMVTLDALPAATREDPLWRAFVLECLADPDHMVRYTAAEAAGRLGLSDAVPALLGLLDDRHELVRLCAVEALGDMKAEAAAAQAAALLVNDPSRRVRGYAAGALAAILGQAAVPLLRERLTNERNRWANGAVVSALYNLGEADVLPLLLRKLRSKDHRIQGFVSNSIQGVADRSHCRPLLATLTAALAADSPTTPQQDLQEAMERVRRACDDSAPP